MDRRELAYAKQTLLSVRDWDTFQRVVRTLPKLAKEAGGGLVKVERKGS